MQNEYMKGKGVNLSKTNISRSGLFSLRKLTQPESLDYTAISDLGKTKFWPIILKEMLIYTKPSGFIIIKSKKIKQKMLLKSCKLLFSDKAALRYQNKKSGTLVFQKTSPFLNKLDSIDKWTIGIITNGKKKDWIEKQIEAIRALKIPTYEIILCGTYPYEIGKDTKYINFTKQDERGWITAKKNKILENAKYENVIVMHDRIVLNPDFLSGMKKYGNYFEVLSCKIFNDKNERCGDWITNGNPYNKYPRLGLLDYKDWDINGWIDGGFYILKKSVWKKIQWDESLFWNEGEDMKLTKDWLSSGILPRFNPFSSCKTLSWRHGEFPKYDFNSYKLGKRHFSVWLEIKDRIMYQSKKLAKRILRGPNSL
ncbi:hypothetical protein CMI45_01325 [Candidatus Pacearchaeota archaeon]|nr:hypothetical protein [Candidatus Pacearchaeota archaeon]|tara:strand:- start:3424 stop:4527 length:1104 start_codon:yes stop_codon:yes gene_type:complete